jgi:hypothetical protein
MPATRQDCNGGCAACGFVGFVGHAAFKHMLMSLEVCGLEMTFAGATKVLEFYFLESRLISHSAHIIDFADPNPSARPSA